MCIIGEVRELGVGVLGNYFGDLLDDMDVENDVDFDIDSSGEFVCVMQGSSQSDGVGCYLKLGQILGG